MEDGGKMQQVKEEVRGPGVEGLRFCSACSLDLITSHSSLESFCLMFSYVGRALGE